MDTQDKRTLSQGELRVLQSLTDEQMATVCDLIGAAIHSASQFERARSQRAIRRMTVVVTRCATRSEPTWNRLLDGH